MKKTILKMIAVAGIVTGSVFTSNAQISIGLTGGFGTGMDLAKPLGGSGDKLASENGFGGGITGRYWLNDNMAVGLNVSYFSFNSKNVPSGVTSSYSVLPISLAFDYYFMDEGFKPFAGLEAGYMIGSWIAKYNANYDGNGNPAFDMSYKNNGLFVAPVVGVAYGINDNFDILLNAKYVLGLNGGKQDLTYSISGLPAMQIDSEASSFVNVNLGVSYKFGN
ncbi:MAG: outer membrane beta-barrel protein [Candidatus Methylacidiphilales bacterium]